MKNKRVLKLVTLLRLSCKTCFDDLMQSDFSYSKILFANLCKSMHDVIIIPVSSIHLKTVERKRKRYKN